MNTISLFDESFKILIRENVNALQLNFTNKDNLYVEVKSDIPEDLQAKEEIDNENSKLTCSFCQVNFDNATEQKEHYKSDWHRYNLKQNLRSKPHVSYENFQENMLDLVSSESESEEEEDSLQSLVAAQGKIFLRNTDGQIFSLYKCLLIDKKEEISEDTLNKKLKYLSVDRKWTLIMLGGGHFAGAVFNEGVPVLHKTFHCYTVRARQGGAQSSRDNKSGGSQPKSAGASLRRYNENALIQHVRDIVETWRTAINECSLVLFRASGPYNRAVLFGGKNPLFIRNDPRLRTIPFSTKRATFTEVKRVHNILCSVTIYDSLETVSKEILRDKSQEGKRTKIKSPNINRAKSREKIERSLPGSFTPTSGSKDSDENSSDSDFILNEINISFKELCEFEDSLTSAQRKRSPSKKHKMTYPDSTSSSSPSPSKQTEWKNHFTELIKKNEMSTICKILLLEKDQENVEDSNRTEYDYPKAKSDEVTRKIILNEPLDENKNTALHLATLEGHWVMILWFLMAGCDPTHKNKNNESPFQCAKNKFIKKCFTRFAIHFPNKYDYIKAEIMQLDLKKLKPNNLKKIIKGGKLGKLKFIFESKELDDDKKKISLNQIIDGEREDTMLHYASKLGYVKIVKYLLEKGASPCCTNIKNKTPYLSCYHKIVRDAFEDYAKSNPDKYDYEMAGIPRNEAEKISLRKKEIQDGIRNGDELELLQVINVYEQEIGREFREIWLNEYLDDEGNTALHFGAACGKEVIVLHLLELGCDPFKINMNGMKPIDVCENEDVKIMLLTYMKKIEEKNKNDVKIANKNKVKTSKGKKAKEKEEKMKREFVEAILRGDLDKLEELIRLFGMDDSDYECKNNKVDDAVVCSNIDLDDNGNKPLHVAALNEEIKVIEYFLSKNFDPACKNNKNQTPYSVTQSKIVRETFRNYAFENPDKFNYNKAQIPLPVFTPEELAEKKRLQRKAKREKEKQKKKEAAIKKKEEEERERFASLSDREKCALAAERRILSAGGTVTSRCFLCGSDMAGQTGFNYMDYKFCNIECLKAHRMRNS